MKLSGQVHTPHVMSTWGGDSAVSFEVGSAWAPEPVWTFWKGIKISQTLRGREKMS